MDEIDRLVLQVKGEADLRKLNAELEKQRAAMEWTIRNQGKFGLVGDTYAAKLRSQAAEVKNLTDQLNQFNARTAGVPTGRQGNGLGQQGMLQLSYAVQDFVSASGGMAQKFNAVTNNLQMIAVSMGLGGGIGLAITGAMAAFQLLANNWSALSDSLFAVDREAMEKGLKKAKDAADRFAALAKTPTKAAASESDIWKNAITETGADKLQKDTAEALFNSPLGAKMTPADREAIEAARRAGQLAVVGGQETEAKAQERFDQVVKEIQNRLAGENAAAAQKMIADAAGTGPDADQARRNLNRLRRDNPNAPTLGGFDPDAAERDARAVAANEGWDSQQEAAGKRKEQMAAYERQIIRENEDAAERERLQRQDEENRRHNASERRRLSRRGGSLRGGIDQTQAQPFDAMEAQMLEAERLSVAPVAQADTMNGMISQFTQRLEQINHRLSQLYARNNQLMGGNAINASEPPALW